VTPAFAAAIDGSMMLRPSCAAARRSASAATALPSRASRQALSRAICSASTCRIDDHDRAVAGDSGEGSVSVKLVDADDDLLAALDLASSGRCCSRPASLHVAGSTGDAPPIFSMVASSARASAFSASTLRATSRSRRRCRRIRADRSRRRGSAACAATIAGPTAAAGRAPRSRPATARRGRARSSTA
jgi:hypothetical protein